MVTRDRAEVAARAVACFAQQTWPERELVIVDDGEVDYRPVLAPYLAEGFRIRYLRGRSSSSTTAGALWDVCVEASSGDWCLPWGDVEWHHPDRIAAQLAASDGRLAVGLRCTLTHVPTTELGDLVFRTRHAFAAPGTILHRRGAARYRRTGAGGHAAFAREIRRRDGLVSLGREGSHLFVRCIHDAGPLEGPDVARRLRRLLRERPDHEHVRWWRDALGTDRAFVLDARECAAADAVCVSTVTARA